jgi:4-azaleucine resistance transporter AzlC
MTTVHGGSQEPFRPYWYRHAGGRPLALAVMRAARAIDPILRQALAIALAVGALGLSFGVLCADTGLGLPMAVALSTLVFAGSAQLAAVGVVADGGTALAAVAAGLLLNARSVAFGVALAPILGGRLGRRLADSHLLIDESAALAAAQSDPADARRAFRTAGLAVLVLWNAGTVAGWLLTGSIDVEAIGLDVVIPAVFVALLAPRMGDGPSRVTALAGAAIALALTPVAPAGLPILLAAAGVGAGLLLARRVAPAA